MTYAEMLAENGASAEDIKILDTPAARKVYERQVAAATEAKRKSDEIIAANNAWREQVETQNQTYLRERDTALADAAANSARMKKLQELGLLQVAENLEPGSTQPKAGETPAFDPKLLEKYVTGDTLMAVAEREGDAIAIAQDISFEHQQLFGSDPTKRLNFRELRKEAVSRKVPVESLWMEKYGVAAARDAAVAKATAEREAKIAADAVSKYKSEHSTTNPMTTIPTVSSTPFSGRMPSATDKAAHPWLKSDGEKEMARTNKGIQGLEKAGLLN
jgi:hypothetical protein